MRGTLPRRQPQPCNSILCGQLPLRRSSRAQRPAAPSSSLSQQPLTMTTEADRPQAEPIASLGAGSAPVPQPPSCATPAPQPAAGVHTSSRFPPPPPSDPLIQTIHLSDILPVVRCVNPVEAQFVHKHVFFGRIGGYGLKQLGLCVRPGDTVVDVGSNIGNFAMWLLKELQGDVRLVVVEPVPPLAACLAANVLQYSVPGLTHASVVNAGCTSPDKSGRPALLSFNPGYTLLSTADRFSGQELDVMASGLQRYTGREDRSELEGVVQSHLAGPEVREVAAAMACLSEVLEAERRPGLELQQIDLLKIDAVKSEWDILQGISDADWDRVRQAVIEVHLGGDVSRLDKVVNLLKAKGFANVRTGWPGTPTFLAYKQYGMMKASASARDAAALAVSVTVPTDGAGKQGAGKEGAGREGVAAGAGAGAGAAPPLELPVLPPPPSPSADEHLLCAVYATRS